MKDVDHSSEANGVNGPISIAILIIDDLQHASATETLQRLGARVFIAVLCIVDRKTHDAANLIRWSSLDDPIHIVGFCAAMRLYHL